MRPPVNILSISATHRGFGVVACVFDHSTSRFDIKQIASGECSIASIAKAGREVAEEFRDYPLFASLDPDPDAPKTYKKMNISVDMAPIARDELKKVFAKRFSWQDPKNLPSPAELLFRLSDHLNSGRISFKNPDHAAKIEFELQDEEDDQKIESDLIRALAIGLFQTGNAGYEWGLLFGRG